MIPIRLRLKGFLSYREPAELDFSGFELACISGENGAGKSSLLDAITWALFGKARKDDEALINAGCGSAEVSLMFEYEGNVYNVQRSKPRGKTGTLEFQIRQPDGSWKPLTEHSKTETQRRLEQILRLDYETFVNASFFLQGKADQFTQQKASDRKKVLANILGLESWEEYKARTAERRKNLESELGTIDGRLAEINAELDEEPARKQRLAELESQLARAGEQRKSQEKIVENIQRLASSLKEQKKLVESLHAQATRAQNNLSSFETKLRNRSGERESQTQWISRAAEIDAAYTSWQSLRAELEKLDQRAGQFRDAEKKREPFLLEIESEKAKLVQEQSTLREMDKAVNGQSLMVNGLRLEVESLKSQLAEIEERGKKKEEREVELTALRDEQTRLSEENKSLDKTMKEMKNRLTTLEQTDGAVCPLCGQLLNEDHRAQTIEQIEKEGREKGDQFRANKDRIKELTSLVINLETEIKTFAKEQNDRVALTAQITQKETALSTLIATTEEWNQKGEPRLKEISSALESGLFAEKARKKLAEIDREIAATGYDPSAHDELRKKEQVARNAETDQRELEKARAALAPLEREIDDLEKEIDQARKEFDQSTKEYEDASAKLKEAEAQAPDVYNAERTLLDLQEKENQLNQEVGAARQKVIVLDDQRSRKRSLEIQREEISLVIGRHKKLESAFGKDGVPALLIEQSLPQIEEKANELLERLSNGAMCVRFVTQAEYKTKHEGVRETLDIQISDGAGTRDYEMFSGGEAFRVNFAIRLALSELLAQRTGARLQTLVIDEGFGSLDTIGRQKMIEAINSIRSDFAKILIITHLDELKEAFPNRIEVEKTPNGSQLRVM